MRTFAEDIEREANESIETVVIGEMGWGDYGADQRHSGALARQGELLSWDEARPLLNYEYDSGYGAPDCNAVYAWTASKILYVVQYDGSTNVYSLPRNPVPCKPEMPGG